MTDLGQRLLWRSESLGVALLDSAGRIVRTSPTLGRLLPTAAAGRAAGDLVVPPQRTAFLTLLRDAGDDWTTLRVAAAADPSRAAIDLRAWVARTGEGVLLVVEPLAQDLAVLNAELLLLNDELAGMERELRRRGEALAEQNDRLRELDRLKEEFVALVSHEFRTPLTSMRGYLELLADDSEQLDPRQRGFVEILERNILRLLRLVEDLLLVVQLDAGALALDLEDVDVAAVVDECVRGIAPAAAEKDVSLECRAGGGPSVPADRARLAQLVDNLLTNAVKFTPSGGRVEVWVEPSAAGGAAIVVADTGIGIPEPERARIFDRFYRVAGEDRRAAPGTGLGLAVVRAIADGHGAAIDVKAGEGGGSVFRVTLPAQAAAAGR